MNEIERLRAARVLVAGDVMLDRYWHGDVERISPEAPVPVVRMRKEELRLGGAANVARNVVTLGARARLLGVVGEDEAGREMSRLLELLGIGDSLVADSEAPTITKLRINGRAQQLLRVDFESEPNASSLDRLQAGFNAYCADHTVIVLSDYGKGGLARVAHKVERARNDGTPILIDPKGTDYSAYRGATVITPNRAELAEVTGKWRSEQDLEDRVYGLRKDLQLEAILLTRSEEGMTLFDDEGRLDIPVEAREVYDVTGAGDTVIATLAVFIGAGLSLREAVPYANRAGGIVVRKFGTAGVEAGELFA